MTLAPGALSPSHVPCAQYEYATLRIESAVDCLQAPDEMSHLPRTSLSVLQTRPHVDDRSAILIEAIDNAIQGLVSDEREETCLRAHIFPVSLSMRTCSHGFTADLMV